MSRIYFVYFLIQSKLNEFKKDNAGVTAIEYALIAVAISSVLFIVLGTGGDGGLTAKIKDAFKAIQDGLGVAQSQSGN